MTSFSYNTDDFPSLLSNESSHQLTSVYIPVEPRERNSKAVSFSNMVNPLLFEKNVFVCTSKMYMFPLQSDNIFRSDTRSPVLSRKSFVFATSGPLHACSFLVPPIAVHNCKNICSCSICSVSLSISNVDRVSKPAYPVVSSTDSVTISVNLLNSLPLIHILLIPVHLRSLLLVYAIFTVNVSCVKV